MEFFENCYIWLAENYNKIIMILQSTQLVSLIFSVLLLLKNVQTVKINTRSSKKLDDTVDKNNQMCSDVANIKEENKLLKEQNEKLKENIESIEKKFDTTQDLIFKKLNAIIDVQSIVYSTIRDDNVRNSVNSILINAKFDENQNETKQKLIEEVNKLKTQLAEEIEKVKNMTETTSVKLDEIVEPKNDKIEIESMLSNFKRY